MTNNKVFNLNEFEFKTAKVGDMVDASVVMYYMNCVPPKLMGTNLAQIGEKYSLRYDKKINKWRDTYTTFLRHTGNYLNGTWKYCGDCFYGECISRGEEI